MSCRDGRRARPAPWWTILFVDGAMVEAQAWDALEAARVAQDGYPVSVRRILDSVGTQVWPSRHPDPPVFDTQYYPANQKRT